MADAPTEAERINAAAAAPRDGHIMRIVCFLQNAWSPLYAGLHWPRGSWLSALHRSRSGQRLLVMRAAAGGDWHYDNTTPVCGPSPDSILPPDLEHVRAVIASVRPHIVVACGRQASRVLCGMELPALLIVPHPAHRVLTNSLYQKAGRLIATGNVRGCCELKQQRGRVQFRALTLETGQ